MKQTFEDRTCTKCGYTQPCTEFRWMYDERGYTLTCAACREQGIQTSARFRKVHPETSSTESSAKWRENNRELFNKRCREWRLNNLERSKEQKRRAYAKLASNPEWFARKKAKARERWAEKSKAKAALKAEQEATP